MKRQSRSDSWLNILLCIIRLFIKYLSEYMYIYACVCKPLATIFPSENIFAILPIHALPCSNLPNEYKRNPLFH